MARQPRETFNSILTEAVAEYVQRGFTSIERLNYWTVRLRQAAEREANVIDVDRITRTSLEAILREQIDRGGILKRHRGIAPFRLNQVRPAIRNELDRRIRASADRIKRNKTEMVEKTMQRFTGWSTSVPPGGTEQADRIEIKSNISKPLSSLPFEERRVLIDQGHKLVSNISEVIAVDAGALCGHWNSHYTQPGYNYRKEHKHFDVDDQFFIVPDNWAMKQGLMKKVGYRYITEVERPGELPFCRCYYTWFYNLASIPAEMLTLKGKEYLQGLR